ncbi:threonine/serine exporter family protein [Secundilactobacillus mixtipabuli]|uniref:Membrane protein n=1 Tax=Secundilactobacillus mixtipabuli TaxID=1435342 RepID=A0A1Z5IBZ9_9LACO|nr:threonine/serine exporter family protein [Secundilactobacillus mixtipabuli]GAW99289.1 membrane protein [Secundilactobacillus mixtipabuli]
MANDQGHLMIKTALHAGRIMIENGSEIARVSDTIRRIAANAGYPDSKVYVTITGIMMSVSGEDNAQIEPVTTRSIDLEKITRVNDLSRHFADQKITLAEFDQRLTDLDQHPRYFPLWLQLISAGVLSGSLEVVFRGNYPDFWVTCLIGLIGWGIFYGVNQLAKVRFLSEFLAAAGIGVLAILAVKYHLGTSADDIIIGSVMPLVPGVPLTNAVRDILAGDLVSGVARGMEALMSAIAIGSGIAMILQAM